MPAAETAMRSFRCLSFFEILVGQFLSRDQFDRSGLFSIPTLDELGRSPKECNRDKEHMILTYTDYLKAFASKRPGPGWLVFESTCLRPHLLSTEQLEELPCLGPTSSLITFA